MSLHIYDAVILDPLYNKWLNGERNGDSSAENWVVMEVFQTSAANIDQNIVWSLRRSQCISHMLDDSKLSERGQVCRIPHNRRNNSLSCLFKPVWLSISQWNAYIIEENLESWANKIRKHESFEAIQWLCMLNISFNISTLKLIFPNSSLQTPWRTTGTAGGRLRWRWFPPSTFWSGPAGNKPSTQTPTKSVRYSAQRVKSEITATVH